LYASSIPEAGGRRCAGIGIRRGVGTLDYYQHRSHRGDPGSARPVGALPVITGHGSSALLGRVAFVANDCITPSGSLYNFDRGRFIIMTVSGDQLYADYSGQMVPTGQGANYVFSGGTFQIVGGTGRYIFASGGGQLSGGEDLLTGAGNIKLSGRISYWAR
jgi:hypothetical protein